MIPLVGQPHGNIAGIVGVIDIDELYGLAADMKRHAIGKADNGIKRADALERLGPFGKALLPGPDLIILHGGPVLGDLVLDDDGGGRREQGRAAGMVAVILSDDDVADRLRRHRLNEFLQNARLGRIVAGVHDHDALRGHDRHGIGVIQLADKGINVIGEFLKFRLVARHGVGA